MAKKVDLEKVLARFFGSTSRARIVTFLFQNHGLSFYQREIMFETGLFLQAVQRELGNLVEIEIISKEEADNRIYYKVDSDSGFFKPLAEICGPAGVKSQSLDALKVCGKQ